MKRLIIEGDWRLDPASQSWCLYQRDEYGDEFFDVSIHQHDVKAIEDIPDPLPTDPGTRFWGQIEGCAPCWWFTTSGPAEDDPADRMVVWIAEDGCTVQKPENDTLTQDRLVRLPDPEVTE